MIFVTVGTTLPFDALIRAADRLANELAGREEVICQIGNGAYTPAVAEFFRFRPGIGELIEAADVVVCHGGTGSTLDMMQRGKRFVAVANPLASDNHQAEFLAALEEKYGILWTDDPDEVPALVERARGHDYAPMDEPNLTDDLVAYLKG